ncbi:hypothetical protein N7497_010369 [Penicillium chrysogenum]|uniref:Uncharacterized protein n=1 Tax=Penicillium chrysogenum TaxID=5076 RepID=A0ABQ8WH35_PENCH|nr:hypothetical protein N7505_004663 [Penicillium chrysogenum]KAJ6148387.1 hypothetical protein N7497_010369 [Penicillium chrysogenum]
MAPRRGGGGYYSSYGNDNPWSETIVLTLGSYLRKSLYITEFAFHILSLIAFVAFLIWACTIRNRSLALKGAICALTSFICRSFASSQINLVVLEAMTIAETEVTMYYLIGLMLTDFFALAAMWFTLYVFWELIHRFLGLTRPSGKPHAAVTTIHYVFLGIVFLVSVAEWGVRVAYYVWSVNFNYELSWTLTQVSCAVYIIHWVLSTEILAWVFFLAIKAGNNAFASKVNPTAILPTKNEPTNWPFQLPAMALFTAAISWCAVCATVAIIGIRYSLLPVYQYDRPVYLSTAISIVEFFLYVGTYTGILLCCAKWHSLGDGDERKYSAPQYQPQYQPQYSAAQFPPREGQYPPIQQQSYGVAPYTDHSAQPQAHPHHVSPH